VQKSIMARLELLPFWKELIRDVGAEKAMKAIDDGFRKNVSRIDIELMGGHSEWEAHFKDTYWPTDTDDV